MNCCDDKIDAFRYLMYPPVLPFLGLNGSGNIFHRTCSQLKKKLEKEGFDVINVSRSSVGDQNFYNVKIDKSRNHEIGVDWKMRKVLGISQIGLVNYVHTDDEHYGIYLIDEDSLNEKYLVDGNLVFEFVLLHNLDSEKLTARLNEDYSGTAEYYKEDNILVLKNTWMSSKVIAEVFNINKDAVVDVSMEEAGIKHIIVLDRVE